MRTSSNNFIRHASHVSRVLELVYSDPAISVIAKSDGARMKSDSEHSAKSALAKTKIESLKLPQQVSDASEVELRLSAIKILLIISILNNVTILFLYKI